MRNRVPGIVRCPSQATVWRATTMQIDQGVAAGDKLVRLKIREKGSEFVRNNTVNCNMMSACSAFTSTNREHVTPSYPAREAFLIASARNATMAVLLWTAVNSCQRTLARQRRSG